ncbi:adenylosuccinate lyase [Acidiferrimicrobium sp. IK]|uniref:adenylosuccinate lyase n=1 Tax=Acidiferrimicrobium sp. IK TaxID=2871700 RepID=UPI0021CB54C6|nr:adenylosuccinate lyase [Acidiferrimicrobium sp. IK]MCU4184276.1 adenylosuccinate lyase [Acidiferrimicrobium sp. IK]
MAALSPLDGRYASQLTDFADAFSEDALLRQRFAVEVEWLLALSQRPEIGELAPVDEATAATMRGWVRDFGAADVDAIKAIERRTNHDVKAVEYHLKDKLAAVGFGPGAEFVHFACTSEDINNLAYTLMLRDGLRSGWLPLADGLVGEVWGLAEAHAALPMPSHTHGQTATPTTLGKELAVFVSRWRRQLAGVRAIPLSAKFNGAVGTYGAHQVAYPEVPWIEVSRQFVEGFGLQWNPLTTQIESHDALGEVLHAVVRTNTILIDFCRDMWEYISRAYLRQQTVAGEVGSSTMPHKVNPIDFENAEANAGVSSALAEHLASKLMISRMQRDLSDSSAIRNLGVAIGHSGLALRAARRGLARVAPSAEVMAADLDGQWEVLAEAIQTVMRRYGYDEPYERLKALTRGTTVGPKDVQEFVKELALPAEAEARLLALTPAGYVGLAPELVAYARPPEQ